MTLKPGGWSREITSRELPVSDTFALVDMNLSPGVREMHTHQQSEFGFVLVGGARNYRQGDVGYVPMGGFHYVQNIGQEKLVFLEFFHSNHFSDVSLAQWGALTPEEVVKSCLNLPDEFLDKLRKDSCPVVKYPGFEFPPANHTPQNVRYFSNFDYIKKDVVPAQAM